MPAEPLSEAREAQRVAALGGQAVPEGVMIRGRSHWAVAVRTPQGAVGVRSFPLAGPMRRHSPVLRGIVAFAESLRLGFRALAEAGTRRTRAATAAALVLGAVLFFLVPAALARGLGGSTPLEAVLRVALIVGYVALLTRLPALRRALEYHGAEHKAVACYEAGRPLTVAAARGCARLHPRCGTTFVLALAVVAGLVYLPLGLSSWYTLVAARVLAFPLAVGLAFELVRWTANGDGRWARALTAPGLALQRLTTREPDAAQLAVALAALEAVVVVEQPIKVAA